MKAIANIDCLTPSMDTCLEYDKSFVFFFQWHLGKNDVIFLVGLVSNIL